MRDVILWLHIDVSEEHVVSSFKVHVNIYSEPDDLISAYNLV
jgi:hypothetical protein